MKVEHDKEKTSRLTQIKSATNLNTKNTTTVLLHTREHLLLLAFFRNIKEDIWEFLDC